eukprot:12671914-Alexandrium_andersonii.AAC.1
MCSTAVRSTLVSGRAGHAQRANPARALHLEANCQRGEVLTTRWLNSKIVQGTSSLSKYSRHLSLIHI